MPEALSFLYKGSKLVVSEESLFCPITKRILVDPVVASDGHTYSLEALNRLMLQSKAYKAFSPVTRELLQVNNNMGLVFKRNLVVEFILANINQGVKFLPKLSENDFLCPITKQLIIRPVIEEDSITYSEDALDDWLANNEYLPCTRILPNTRYKNYWVQKIIKDFLCAQGFVIDVNHNGYKELMLAIKNSNGFSIMHLIKKHKIILTQSLNARDDTLLHVVAFYGRSDLLSLFNYDVANFFIENNFGFTPIHYAVLNNSVKFIDYLYSQGHDSLRQPYKGSLLALAISNNSYGCAKKLSLYYRAFETIYPGDKTILHCAAQYSLNLLKFFLKKVRCTDLLDCHKNHFLHFLPQCKSTSVKEYKKIIKSNTSTSPFLNDFGLTPLHIAARENNIYFVLAYKKANSLAQEINSLDMCGFSPLEYAVINQSITIIKKLIQYGAIVDFNIYGASIFKVACKTGNLEIFKLLYAHSTKVIDKDCYGLTMWDYARLFANKNIVNFLLDTCINTIQGTANCYHFLAASSPEPNKWHYVAKYPQLLSPDYLPGVKARYCGVNPLEIAVVDNNYSALEFLLECSKAVQYNKRDLLGLSWVFAMHKCSKDILNILISNTHEVEKLEMYFEVYTSSKLINRIPEFLFAYDSLGGNWLHKDKCGQTILLAAQQSKNLQIQQYLLFKGLHKWCDDSYDFLPAKHNTAVKLRRTKSFS